MILDRAPEDEPLIPTERTKIRLEMMRTKKRMLNKENLPVNSSFTANRTIKKGGSSKREEEKDLHVESNIHHSILFNSKKEFSTVENCTDSEVLESGSRSLARNMPGTGSAFAKWDEASNTSTSWETEDADKCQARRREELKIVIPKSSNAKDDEAIFTMSEGDATTTKIYESAPHSLNTLSIRNRMGTKPKPKVFTNGEVKIIEEIFIESPSNKEQTNVKKNEK